MKRTFIFTLALLALSVPAGHAAEVRVLSAGAVEPGLVRLADAFRRETGQQVHLTVGTPAALRKKVTAGETAEVLIVPPTVIDALVKSGMVAAEGRAVIGRVGVGVTVRSGATAPDISTPEALKQAVLRADSLVYNEASTGVYFAKLLERLGIADEVKGKSTRYPDGAAVLEHVIRGGGSEIGIGAMTEIMAYTTKGLKLVGPLPADIQNYTTYIAGVMVGARSPDAAQAFIRFLTSPTSKAVFAAIGVD